LSLKLPRVYYGWWIVGACFLIGLYTGGAIFYAFTAVFEPIANEFGWSYAQISLAASLRGLELGLLAPVVGSLVDRWGPRRIIFGSMVIASVGLIVLSLTNSLLMYYGAFILIAVGMSGGGSTVTITTVANWFRRKVGIAAGIMICGYGSSGILIPLVVKLIDVCGWRWAMAILAIGMIVICLPLSLLIRHKPEKYGLLPDGDKAGPGELATVSLATNNNEINISARQALRSRTFWYLALGLMPYLMAIYSVSTHVMPYLSSIGLMRTSSSLVATAIPLVSLAGRFGFGWLGDRLNKKRLVIASLVMTAFGLAAFEFAGVAGTWLLVLFLLLFGIGYGGAAAMLAVLSRYYFGRSSFGTILGFMQGVMIFGSIGTPTVTGWVFDTWGSYRNVWLVFGMIAVAGAILMATIPPMSAETKERESGRTSL